jgi:hypothetical protein
VRAEGCAWCRQSEHDINLRILWKRKSTYFGTIEKENPGARAGMHVELEGDGGCNKEMT